MTEQTPSLEHPQVRKNAERYEIVVDDAGTVAGFTVAIDDDAADGPAQRIFPHTKVDHQYEGRGLASTLVREALKDTVAAGRRIRPRVPVREGLGGRTRRRGRRSGPGAPRASGVPGVPPGLTHRTR
ncbi:GNAT family N-acetyltransferase [Micrococcus luteus]|uniref:GNAT family N-acetyltransferase n=1 Tax=Micrococcus luteus TaxID=1270 RepID=UPI001F50F358|nr:N-acetyltransferase [Micrococcus luteus]